MDEVEINKTASVQLLAIAALGFALGQIEHQAKVMYRQAQGLIACARSPAQTPLHHLLARQAQLQQRRCYCAV